MKRALCLLVLAVVGCTEAPGPVIDDSIDPITQVDGGPVQCPDANDPGVRYVSPDINVCAAAFFACRPDERMFISRACGCGCEPAAGLPPPPPPPPTCPDPNDPRVTYVSPDIRVCAAALFMCPADREMFVSPACGCGCK